MVQIVNPITIVKQGGGPTPLSDLVVFVDLDGNVVETWEVSSLASKTALPANPTAPSGLTAKGWNWTLQELQTENRPMVVGQIYAPTDGKTHLFVEVESGYLSPVLGIGLNGTATVDWGDGSAVETLTGSSVSTGVSIGHTYANPGNYEVVLDVPTGSSAAIRGATATVSFLWRLPTWSSTLSAEHQIYAAQLEKLWLGERISIDNGGLTRLGLTEIVIPDYYPGIDIGSYYMYLCSRYMKPVILPRAVTTIPTYFMSNVLTTYNSFISLPPTVTTIGDNFLRSSGDNGLFNQPLAIPSSVTSIGGSFLAGQKAFNQSLTIPSGVTSIGLNFMQNCYSFNQPLTIPSGVTNIKLNFMQNCYSFNQPLTIPSSVTSIGGYFMQYCHSLSTIIVDTANSPSDNYSLSEGGPNVKAYADGIVVKGAGRSAWLTNLPNLAGPQYRKLIDGGE